MGQRVLHHSDVDPGELEDDRRERTPLTDAEPMREHRARRGLRGEVLIDREVEEGLSAYGARMTHLEG